MKAAVICIIGLVGAWDYAAAESRVEGRVRLDSGAPVPGAQVLLFDLTDLRAAPLAATTDRAGRFTLPLANRAGVLPQRFELGANYPNPFNPSTVIPYQLPVSMHVRLEVFNLMGQRVATLVDGEQSAGFHTTLWDATDAAGQAVAAGVYLYRLSGAGASLTRRLVLIDGQAGGGRAGSGPAGLSRGAAGTEIRAEGSPAYGLTVSGGGLVPYVDPDLRADAGRIPLDVVVEAPGRVPSAKAASSGGILGDVDNTGSVDFFDALLVALYSRDPTLVMPNSGDVSLGDVNADGQVDLTDAYLIAMYLNDPSNPALPPGIGEPAGPATATLSPDPSTVTLRDDGAWHRFTVQASEPVVVVANPSGTATSLEITTRSGRGNYCPAEQEDDHARRDGQAIYLAGCATGPATVELRRAANDTVLQTYVFTVEGEGTADLVVEAPARSDSSLTPGQSFTLSVTVRNQGNGESAATTLRYYRSSNATISTRDTQVGTDPVGVLAASGTSAESIALTAPSSAGTYYYGACVESVSGESDTGNNCSRAVRITATDSGSLTSPPPTWVFAGDVPAAYRTELRAEMEQCRAYFAGRFGVEATDFTVLAGPNFASLDSVYRSAMGEEIPFLEFPWDVHAFGFVTQHRVTGEVFVALVYRGDPSSLLDIVVHEYFHVLQRQLASVRAPRWLVEGLASYADYAYTLSRPDRRGFLGNRYTPYVDIADAQSRGAFGENINLVGLEDMQTFRCDFDEFYSYAMSFAASVFLVEQLPQVEEEDALVSFWELLANRPWEQAFEESFGMSAEDFYQAFDAWLPTQLPSVHLIVNQMRYLEDQSLIALDRTGWVDPSSSHQLLMGLLLSPHDATSHTIRAKAASTNFVLKFHGDPFRTAKVGLKLLELGTTPSDQCNHLLGWYKDGKLTDQLEEATLVEFTETSTSLEWTLPAHPSKLPRKRLEGWLCSLD